MAKQKTPQVTQQQTTSLGDAYAAFVVARQALNVTPRTLGYYADKLRPFITHCEQSNVATVDQVTAATVRAYLVSLQRRGLAPATVHGAARAIRAFLRFCADLDTTSGAVLVREGKGRKARTVYLGAKTRRELGHYWRTVGRPAAKGPVWVSLTTGARLTDSGLRQLLQRLGERAKVDHCHPHTFRRTFALWSLRGGMDIHTLAALMGHADIGVLRQYLALSGADLQRAHQAAGPVDRMFKR